MAYERFANGGLSSLAAGIDDSVLALTVKSAVGFPTGGNFRIIVESEIMLVTDVQGKTFTVTRAQEGTSAAAHLRRRCRLPCLDGWRIGPAGH